MSQRWARWTLAGALAWALLEAAASLALWGLAELGEVRFVPLPTRRLPATVAAQLDRFLQNRNEYLQHDPVLGWSIRPGGSVGDYRANGQGLRAERDFAPRPLPGVLRIATFGDSFTHGDDVAGHETWQSRLEARLPGVELLNFGVPAYGPGQALLRYREQGRSMRPQLVLIGVMAENIFRAVNVFRPFYSSRYRFPLAKPRFALQGGELVLRSNPLPALTDYARLRTDPRATLAHLGKHDFFFQRRCGESAADGLPSVRLGRLAAHALTRKLQEPVLAADGSYNTQGEAFAVLAAVVDRFRDEVREDGAVPVVLLFPDVIRKPGAPGRPPYGPLADRLAGMGALYVDLQEAFDERAADLPRTRLSTGRWGHYSAEAHGIVAEHLAAVLRDRGLLEVSAAVGESGSPR